MAKYIELNTAISAALKCLEGKITTYDALDVSDALEECAVEGIEIEKIPFEPIKGKTIEFCKFDPNCGAKMKG